MKTVLSIIFASLIAFSSTAHSHDGGKKKHKKKACCTQMQAQGGCTKDAAGNLPACCTKRSGKQCSKDCPHHASAQPANAKPGCHHDHSQPHHHNQPNN